MSLSPTPQRSNLLNNNGYRYNNRIPLSPARRDFSPPPNLNFNSNLGPNTRPRRQINNNGLTQESSQPLIEPDATGSVPPLAGPEIDDLDDRDIVTNAQPGVDDGFFTPGNNEHPDAEELPKKPKEPEPINPIDDGPEINIDDFPYAPGYGPDVYGVNVPDYPGTEFGGTDSIPDVNVYQHKKTLAQGMMDLALFSANANQLRYVLESYDRHPYYYPSIVLISFSLLFQIAVGVGLIWNARYNVKDQKEICIANKINNFTIIGIFLVTVVNVFISAFGVANAPSTSPTK